jgi:hypothetical protein
LAKGRFVVNKNDPLLTALGFRKRQNKGSAFTFFCLHTSVMSSASASAFASASTASTPAFRKPTYGAPAKTRSQAKEIAKQLQEKAEEQQQLDNA